MGGAKKIELGQQGFRTAFFELMARNSAHIGRKSRRFSTHCPPFCAAPLRNRFSGRNSANFARGPGPAVREFPSDHTQASRTIGRILFSEPLFIAAGAGLTARPPRLCAARIRESKIQRHAKAYAAATNPPAAKPADCYSRCVELPKTNRPSHAGRERMIELIAVWTETVWTDAA
jgi:hypothetical protein